MEMNRHTARDKEGAQEPYAQNHALFSRENNRHAEDLRSRFSDAEKSGQEGRYRFERQHARPIRGGPVGVIVALHKHSVDPDRNRGP